MMRWFWCGALSWFGLWATEEEADAAIHEWVSGIFAKLDVLLEQYRAGELPPVAPPRLATNGVGVGAVKPRAVVAEMRQDVPRGALGAQEVVLLARRVGCVGGERMGVEQGVYQAPVPLAAGGLDWRGGEISQFFAKRRVGVTRSCVLIVPGCDRIAGKPAGYGHCALGDPRVGEIRLCDTWIATLRSQ